MSHRYEGRNLEDALESAAQGLGVERWQLTYHVLLEKRGFLGGVKRVVIEADVNREAPPPPAAQPVTPVAAEPRPPVSAPTPARERERERKPPRARSPEHPRGPREARGGRRGRRPPQDDLQAGDFEKFFVDAPEQGPESDDARKGREWIERVITLARLDLVARTEENETQVLVRLYGGDEKRMIDRHGELLDAVQVLANKALVGRIVQKEIELDCGQFKDRRNEELGQKAREVAERVRREGREELLPAMSPIERRIVHLALRDDEVVTTESRGEGFYKRVAVILRSAVAEPADAAPEQ